MLKRMVTTGLDDESTPTTRMSPGIRYIHAMLSTVDCSTGQHVMMPQLQQVILNGSRLVVLYCLRRHLLFNRFTTTEGKKYKQCHTHS